MSQVLSTDRLPRVVGRYGLLFYGLGNIIGAGVYVLIGSIAERAGYAAPVSFLIAAVAAMLTAFSYVELTGIFPVAASESVYIYKAFKKQWLSTTVGFALFIAAVVSAATLVASFAGYFGVFAEWPDQFTMSLVVLVMLGVVLIGIRETVRVAVAFTIIEILGLLVVMVGTAVFENGFGTNFLHSLALIPTSVVTNPALVVSGSFLAFYAFIGFEDMVGMAEEVKEPHKNYPFAIITAISIATALYMLVALTALTVLTPTELAASKAPLASVFSHATGWSPLILSAIGLVAITNGLLAHFVTGSRMLYGMSNQGWIPDQLVRVNKRNVPYAGAFIIAVLTLFCALTMSLSTLAELTSLCLLSVFTLVNISLIVLRSKRHVHSVSRLRSVIPWLGAFVSLTMLVVRMLALL